MTDHAVQGIRRRYNRKTGRVAITFEVTLETWRAMVAAGKAYSYEGGLEYVEGALNRDFLSLDQEAWPEPEPEREAETETEAGPLPEGGEGDRDDDDIPF